MIPLSYLLKNYKTISDLFILILIITLLCGCGLRLPKKKIIISPDNEAKIQQKKLPELLAQARRLAKRKNYPEALHAYNKALEMMPDKSSGSILSEIDQILLTASSKDIRQMLDTPDKQIAQTPLFYYMGSALFKENRQEEATYFLKRFLSENSDGSDSWNNHKNHAQKILDTISQSNFPKATIGCLLPLSGKYALFGQQALQGIQLAIQDIYEQLGVSVKIIIRDTKGDPQKAMACVDELAENSVMGIIGPLVTAPQAGSKAQELGIPMICLTQKTDFLANQDFVFSNFITPEGQVKSLANYIFTTLGIKTTAILYPDEPYGKTFMKLFWDAAKSSGGEIKGVRSYEGSLTDFSIPIKKLTGQYFQLPSYLKPEKEEGGEEEQTNTQNQEVKLDFQALFIPDGPSRLSLILPQLLFNDIKDIILIGTNLYHNVTLLEEFSKYQGDIIITDAYLENSSMPGIQEFSNTFQQLFKSKPGLLEAAAYDTIKIFFTAAQDPDVNSWQDLKAILKSQKIFHGLTGDTWFNDAGIAQKTLFLMTVKKGQFIEID